MPTAAGRGWDWSLRPPHTPAPSRDTWARVRQQGRCHEGANSVPGPSELKHHSWAMGQGQVRLLGAIKGSLELSGTWETFRDKVWTGPQKVCDGSALVPSTGKGRCVQGCSAINNPTTQSCPQFPTSALLHNQFVPREHSELIRSSNHKE